MKKLFLLILSASIFSCNTPEQTVKTGTASEYENPIHQIKSVDDFFHNSGTSWADSILKTMPLRKKIAQLIFPRSYSWYFSRDSKEYVRIEKLIKTDQIGGLVVFLGDVFEEATLLNEFQSMSNIPLWVMQDSENGLAMRIRNATLFPHMMTLGAINDTNLTRRVGIAIGQENRAVGVHQALAPVLDVNNNPMNPVINIRSFGADPDLVSIHASAMMTGLQQGGVLATAKHFPGHGDTGTDSHVDLPVLPYDFDRLNSIELKPYDKLMANGLKSVMIAHLALPKISGNYDPATLSKPILDSLLFKRYHFDGLVVTDAMDMGAVVKKYGSGNAAVMALTAGVDIVILPVGEEQVIDAIAAAVVDKKLTESKIDSSVLKILRLKEKFKLNENRFTNLLDVRNKVATAKNLMLADEVANRSLTLVKNEKSVVPFKQTVKRENLTVFALSDFNDPIIADEFIKQLKQNANKSIDFTLLDKRSNALDYEIATRKIKSANDILVVTYSNVVSGRGKIGLEQNLKEWLLTNSADMASKKSILVGFGNPYIVNDFPNFNSVIVTYSISDRSQKSIVLALTGQIPFEGRLPINLKNYPIGSGIITTQPQISTSTDICKLDDEKFNIAEDYAAEAILEGVTPSIAIGVIDKGKLVYQNTFGNQIYSADSPAVQCSTLYDLASLTKVFSTTLAVMKLVENNQLKLEDKLSKYYPDILTDAAKSKITLTNLLTHTSGFEAWKPFHLMGEPSKDEIISYILKSKLIYQTGDSSIYSDWNFILLGEIVEKLTSKKLSEYVSENIYSKLNLKHTLYNPINIDKSQIVPTEMDSVWRKRLVQGSVHDETAQLMGGVSGHAGLFSTIQDLMKLTQMLINKGTLDGVKIFKPETIELFTKTQKFNRALGWDLRSKVGYKSSGNYFGPLSFGHLGYTGTSIWIDPEKKTGIVILTNRVYPTRDNKKISDFRPKMHDLIMKALGYDISKN